jgi:hypothetical protein
MRDLMSTDKSINWSRGAMTIINAALKGVGSRSDAAKKMLKKLRRWR